MESDAFLAQEIATSSPARLRFLLLQKATGLCKVVEDQWAKGQHTESMQWVLRIQEILSELLDGVQAGSNQLARQVSDIYVYLLKLWVVSVQELDLQGLRTAREILEIEQDTWAAFVANETRQFGGHSARGHAFENDDEEYSALDLQS